MLLLLPRKILRFLRNILVELLLIGRRKSLLEISLEIQISIHLSFPLFTLSMFYLHLLCLSAWIFKVLWRGFGMSALHLLDLVLFYYIIPHKLPRLHK